MVNTRVLFVGIECALSLVSLTFLGQKSHLCSIDVNKMQLFISPQRLRVLLFNRYAELGDISAVSLPNEGFQN